MHRIIGLLALGVALSGCDSPLSGGPETERINTTDGIALSGLAEVDRNLLVKVFIHNESEKVVKLVVLDACPIIVDLYPAGVTDAAPAYSEADRPCTRAGRRVQIPPGQRRELERSIPLSELREGGIAAGRYRIVGFVTARDQDELAVDLGQVSIPSQ